MKRGHSPSYTHKSWMPQTAVARHANRAKRPVPDTVDARRIAHAEVAMENADKLARAHPASFEIPSHEKRNGLRPGDYAKVLAGAERFWIEVIEVAADGYVGRAASPIVTLPIRWGDPIGFGPEHVIAVMTECEQAEAERELWERIGAGGSYADNLQLVGESVNSV